jgi:hypothetical protein
MVLVLVLLLTCLLAASTCLGFSYSAAILSKTSSNSLWTRNGPPLPFTPLHHHHHHHNNRFLFMTSSLMDNTESGTTAKMAATNANQDDQDINSNNSNNSSNNNSLRSSLRRLTGFSLTAFRATMRAATGISLTAVYASTVAATSALVRNTMTMILSPLPPWMRYFLQPLLILYYVPLFVLRSVTGPTGKQARETHDLFLLQKSSWQSAVDKADQKVESYWPTNTSTLLDESIEDGTKTVCLGCFCGKLLSCIEFCLMTSVYCTHSLLKLSLGSNRRRITHHRDPSANTNH